MPWYKYREKMSYGSGSWEYIQLNCPLDQVEQYLEDRLNDWSDQWRSVEIKHVPVPPKHVLFYSLKSARQKLKNVQENVNNLEEQCKKYYKKVPNQKEAEKVYDDFIEKEYRKSRRIHKESMRKNREKLNRYYINNILKWMKNQSVFDVDEFDIVESELSEFAKAGRLEGFYLICQRVCKMGVLPRYLKNVNIIGNKNDINSWAAFYLKITTKPPSGESLVGLNQETNFNESFGIYNGEGLVPKD